MATRFLLHMSSVSPPLPHGSCPVRALILCLLSKGQSLPTPPHHALLQQAITEPDCIPEPVLRAGGPAAGNAEAVPSVSRHSRGNEGQHINPRFWHGTLRDRRQRGLGVGRPEADWEMQWDKRPGGGGPNSVLMNTSADQEMKEKGGAPGGRNCLGKCAVVTSMLGHGNQTAVIGSGVST